MASNHCQWRSTPPAACSVSDLFQAITPRDHALPRMYQCPADGTPFSLVQKQSADGPQRRLRTEAIWFVPSSLGNRRSAADPCLSDHISPAGAFGFVHWQFSKTARPKKPRRLRGQAEAVLAPQQQMPGAALIPHQREVEILTVPWFLKSLDSAHLLWCPEECFPRLTGLGSSEGDAARWPPSGCVFARQLMVPKNVFNLISYRILSHQPE